jgi:hypothetical protein
MRIEVGTYLRAYGPEALLRLLILELDSFAEEEATSGRIPIAKQVALLTQKLEGLRYEYRVESQTRESRGGSEATLP